MAPPKGHLPYNTNGEGGRPKIYTNDHVNHLAECLDNWIDTDKENIFIEDWCLEFAVPEETISKDLINFDRFSQAYKRLKTKQKVCIFKGGLKRKYAHPMCALLLSHVHNIHAKTETTVTNTNKDSLDCVIDEIDGNTKDLLQSIDHV